MSKQETTIKIPKLKLTASEAMASQMSDFACEKTEDTIVSELINNTVEEHLLLEFAFEMMLKNLLREPGTQ